METNIDTWQVFDRSLLAMKGELYPTDMKFEICSPSLNSIRKWRNIDENNPASISMHITSMVSNCVRVTSESGSNEYDPKDLYEHDKLAFLLGIFKAFSAESPSEHNLFVEATCPDCGKVYDKLAVQISNLTYKLPAQEMVDKYFDKELGYFVIKTKDFDDIMFKPSTIGLGQVVSKWSSTLDFKFLAENQDTVLAVQSLFTDWRGLTEAKVRKAQIEQYNLMTEKRKLFQMHLLDNVNVTPEGTLEYVCAGKECGARFRAPISYTKFNKALFMPVQSFTDQLL